MTDQIFISYRRDDAAYVTGHINDLLRKEFGDDAVFTDVDNIALGVDFRSVLDQTVSQCQVLLAVIGPDWLTVRDQDGQLRLQDPADFVRIEIESALQRNIPVIPLLVAGATMPAAEELPESLRGLAFRNGTQIRPAPDFTVDMARLIKNLQRHFVATPAESGDEIGIPMAPGSNQGSEPEQEPPGIHINVGEEDRARRAELGIARQNPKKRWLARMGLIAIVLIVGAALYFVGRNQDVIEDVLSTNEPAVPVEAEIAVVEPADAPPEVADNSEDIVEVDTASELSDGATFEPAAAIEGEPEAGDVDEVIDDVDASPAEVDDTATSLETETETEAETEGEVEAEAELEAVTEAVAPPEPPQPDASELVAEGVRLAALGDHEAAVQVFDEAIQLDAEQSFFYKQRGASYQALRQFEAAIGDYNEAIRLNSEDVNAIYNRGITHYELEDFAAAIEDFDVVIEADPGFTNAYSRRADAYEAMGDTEAAERDREDAAEF